MHAIRYKGLSTTDCQLLFYGADSQILQLSVYEPDVSPEALPEALVQALWGKQQFASQPLKTVLGLPLRVFKPGTLNHDTGPDFRDAMLGVGDTLWHGDVEIHRTSQAWYAHQHHLNPRYNSTILHVSLFADASTGTLRRADGSVLPELVLGPYLKKSLRSLLYTHRKSADKGLPCKDLQQSYKGVPLVPWLTTLTENRLRRKKQRIETAFLHTPDLEILLYQLMLAGLGYAKNIGPMLQLAKRLPLALGRTVGDTAARAGLFLGAAGLLSSKYCQRFSISRPQMSAYSQLLAKHQVVPMPDTAWQFFRLRPTNFPTVRLLQAASLFNSGSLFHRDAIGLLNNIMHAHPPAQWVRVLQKLLKQPPAAQPAWAQKTSGMGRARINKLIFNAICPVMLVYAEQAPDPALEKQIYAFMQYMKFEHDRVTRFFSGLALPPDHAGISQGLHELHETYCQRGRCVSCKIGKSLIYNDLE